MSEIYLHLFSIICTNLTTFLGSYYLCTSPLSGMKNRFHTHSFKKIFPEKWIFFCRFRGSDVQEGRLEPQWINLLFTFELYCILEILLYTVKYKASTQKLNKNTHANSKSIPHWKAAELWSRLFYIFFL